jgi:hypothetical protein
LIAAATAATSDHAIGYCRQEKEQSEHRTQPSFAHRDAEEHDQGQ